MIDAYLTDTAVITPWTRDKYNDFSAGTPFTVDCHVTHERRRVETPGGQDSYSEAKVLVALDDNTRAVTLHYKITIAGVEFGIVALGRKRDFAERYVEIFIK